MTATATRSPQPPTAPPVRRAPAAASQGSPPSQQAGSTVAGTNLAALAGALAVIGGSTALSPLIEGYGWLLPVAELVAIIYLIGAGARLVATPAWAVSLLQVIGFVIAFTGLHLHTGIGGVLPGRAALGEAGDLLTVAWSQIMTTVPPAPVTVELSMIISLLLGVIALVVDALIAGCHAPAMSALPLLGLYSVPAAIADDMLPWYAFVLPAICYVAVLAASGAGKVHLSGRAATHAVLVGCLIAAVSVTGAIFGADAVSSVGTEGRLPVHGSQSGEVGLSPWARLRGQLTDSKPTDMMSVSGIEQPGYLRAFALDEWTPNEGFGPGPLVASDRGVDGPLPIGSGFAPRDIAAADTTTATITPSHYRDKYLPIYLDSVAVGGLESGWDYDSALRTVFRAGKTTPEPYQVTVPTTPVSEEKLRTEPFVDMPQLKDTDGVPDSVTALSRSIIDKAGATTVFDAADALLHYFTDPANGFRYSLKVPLGNTGDALTDFLTQKTGYCEQYAAALAVMLRSIGIPARVGIGFTQGARQPDGSYLIESTNAHAWVEVPFRDSGWIIFDPTPAVGGQGGLQGFETGAAPGGGASVTTTASTTPTTSTGPTTSLSLDGALPNQGAKLPEADLNSGSQSTAKTGFLARFGVPLLITLGSVVLLLLILLAPTTVRRWRRRHRLAAVAAGRDPAATAWLEITDTMRDHGLTVDDADSARTTANTLAQATRLSTQERSDLKDIVTAAEARWYGHAPEAGDAGRDTAHDAAHGDFARGVRGVVGALARTKPLRGLRRWWPASLSRYRPG